jgi:hypothetical protein
MSDEIGNLDSGRMSGNPNELEEPFIMLTQQHQEELLHRAYMSALASKAGVNLALQPYEFDYGTDGSFSLINIVDRRRNASNIDLNFQLKSSKNITIKDGKVSCRISIAAYSKLIEQPRPPMLIILALPENESERVEFTNENIILRKCCFWTYLQPDGSNTAAYKEDSTKTIYLPCDNILTPDIVCKQLEALRTFAEKTRKEYLECLLK